MSSTGSGSKDNKTVPISKGKQACVGALACLKTVKGPSKPSTVQKAASNNLKRKIDELSLPGTAIVGSADAGPSKTTSPLRAASPQVTNVDVPPCRGVRVDADDIAGTWHSAISEQVLCADSCLVHCCVHASSGNRIFWKPRKKRAAPHPARRRELSHFLRQLCTLTWISMASAQESLNGADALLAAEWEPVDSLALSLKSKFEFLNLDLPHVSNTPQL